MKANFLCIEGFSTDSSDFLREVDTNSSDLVGEVEGNSFDAHRRIWWELLWGQVMNFVRWKLKVELWNLLDDHVDAHSSTLSGQVFIANLKSSLYRGIIAMHALQNL